MSTLVLDGIQQIFHVKQPGASDFQMYADAEAGLTRAIWKCKDAANEAALAKALVIVRDMRQEEEYGR